MPRILTSQQDVINNFKRYLGRTPNQSELNKYMYAAPATVEADLKAAKAQIEAANVPAVATRPNTQQFSSASSTVGTPTLVPSPGSSAREIDAVQGTNTVNSTTVNTPTANNTANLSTSQLGASGVNALFKQYYGRDATKDELAYWSNKSDADLRPNLIPNSATELARSKQAPTQEKPPEDEWQKLTREKGLAYINSQNYSPAEKAIMIQLLEDGINNKGKVFQPAELESMMATAATNAEQNISPYYQKKSQQEIEDMKNQFAFTRNEASRFAQKEAKSYRELLDTTRKNLRASGLTFSGASRKELGGEGALNRAQDVGENGTNQFGMVEGQTPQARRYMWEDQVNAWNEKNLQQGIKGERLLGSKTMQDAGLSGDQLGYINNPYAGGQIDYNQNGVGYQYKVKEAPGGTPQEGYIRSGDQAQFTGASNYRFLSEMDLEKQKAIEQARLANLQSMVKPISTK